MTICNVCIQDKPSEEFNFRDRAKGLRQLYCRVCDSVRRKASYYRHRSSTVEKQVERNRLIRDEFRDFKATLSCEVCKEDATECLDFHHMDPSKKEFTISEANIHRGPKFENELSKCVVLCSNCHRKVHSGRITCPRMPPVFETGES